MRFLEKLIAKRDAAKVEYDKWQSMIDTFTNDPDFAKTIHNGAVAKMNGAVQKLSRSEIVKRTWTPERRAKFSAQMKGNPASSQRLKELRKDPAFQAKRLKAFRKAMKAKKAARAAEA